MRVRLFHWKPDEAQARIDELRQAGFTVDYRERATGDFFRSIDAHSYSAIVIDLTRMPSHGRSVALVLRARKSTRQIPIVFLDGDPEKVNRIRKDLPDAVYTTGGRLVSTLKRVKPIANPVYRRPAMETYPERSTAQKLGIRPDSRTAVIDPPAGYLKALGPLPSGASIEEDPTEPAPITLWFVREPETLLSTLPRIRNLAAKSRIWIIYPKQRPKQKESSGITQFFIRESALAVGLVDYKICSVDGTWTGLLFTLKK